jgi:hypothetical protein
MKFPYIKLPVDPSGAFPERKTILRPIIPIVLEFGQLKTGYMALIDSGADYCFFHSEIAEVLGLDWRKGKSLNFIGVTGQRATAYFYNINLYIGGWSYKLYCGFSTEVSLNGFGVLGQIGFFDQFIVKFDLEKEEIEIRPRQ